MKKPLFSHPAVAAAESDLVKLTREHETLANEIAVANDRRQVLIEELNAIDHSQRVRQAKIQGTAEFIYKKMNGSQPSPF